MHVTSPKQPMTTAGIPGDAGVRPPKVLRYHLRFQIMPGENVARDTQALADFCTAHGVEEVVLFYAGEEWHNGLLSSAEEDLWVDIVRRAKQILEAAGIVVSLNPWTTVGHLDRGQRLPADRGLEPAVSPIGEVAAAVGSFGDPAWRSYIEDQFGLFAQLGFRVIWVEDDFRYHNHPPLTWGSGFEPPVLKRFAAQVGQDVSREEVLNTVLQPGEPHPWRAMWLRNEHLSDPSPKGVVPMSTMLASRPKLQPIFYRPNGLRHQRHQPHLIPLASLYPQPSLL